MSGVESEVQQKSNYDFFQDEIEGMLILLGQRDVEDSTWQDSFNDRCLTIKEFIDRFNID